MTVREHAKGRNYWLSESGSRTRREGRIRRTLMRSNIEEEAQECREPFNWGASIPRSWS